MDINKMMPMDVILSVINFVGITEDEFGTRSRHQPVVISKVIVTYCFLYMGLSNTFIGRIILKDHSTITHYKKLIRDDLFIRRWIIRYKAHMESLGWYIPGLDRWDGDGLGVRRYGKT